MKISNFQKEKQWILREKYGGELTQAAKKDIARLERGEPVDYVIGYVEFLGCKIDVSKRPLIPRVETAFWVQKIIGEIKKDKPLRVLDIFSGSGCIGVAVLKHVKNSAVVFADREFLNQVKINCKLNKIDEKRYQTVTSDIFSGVKGRFDIILANPPYIPTTNKKKIQPSVLRYEPNKALFGGSDGMVYIRKFLTEAENFLNPGGKISMEFDPPQRRSLGALLKKLSYDSFEFHRDQYGKWRYLVIK